MPFSIAFQQRRTYERLQRIRQKPGLAFGIAVALVAVATGLLWAAGPQLIEAAKGEDRFSFLWIESRGPSVSPPLKKGFGSVIIEESARQFADRVTLDYAPHGFRYELQVKLSDIKASKESAAQAS